MIRMTLDVGAELGGRLAELARVAAQAEWVLWNDMVTAADRLNKQVDQTEEHFHRMVERSAIPLTIGRMVGLSEGQVASRVAVGVRVRSKAPNTWAAFKDGRVDGSRVREVSSALDRLRLEQSWQRLDRVGLAYAETHTVAEFRAWVKRFVARVEPEGFNARADDARRRRSVSIVHGDDGMGVLTLYQSSHLLAAIENRVTSSAKEHKLGADPATPTMNARWSSAAPTWSRSGCWPTITGRST